ALIESIKSTVKYINAFILVVFIGYPLALMCFYSLQHNYINVSIII
ncbi:MAG: hypothetical protein NT02SARS_1816, partial [SAR86 cluster bacterium SAR86B]